MNDAVITIKREIIMKKLMLSMMLLALLLSTNNYANEGKEMQLPKLSVQLWSVRDDLKRDFKGTLKQLADMGFKGVEFAGYFGPYKNNGKGLKKFLSELGLKASGAHVNFKQFNDKNYAKSMAFYQDLDAKLLIVGSDKRAFHPQGIKAVVNELNQLSAKLAPLGFKFGFHNHDDEFNDFKGSTYWDYLAKNTIQDVVLQQDVGWTTYAGKNPIEYVERYPGRTLTTHYKASLPKGTQGKLPIIGEDTIDWLNLIKSNMSVGGTLWLVVEQEEYPNGLTPLQAVRKSKQGLDKILKQVQPRT